MKANLRFLAALTCASVLIVGAFAQGPGGGQGRGRGRGGGASLGNLLRRPDVQSELKLSTDEIAKLDELRNANRPQGAPSAAGAPTPGAAGGGVQRTPPDPTAMAARREAERKAIQAILTTDQFSRLQELVIQREGVRAITHKEVQDKLGISDDQKSKVKDLMDKFSRASRDLREKVQNQEMDRRAMRTAMTTNNKVLTEELGKILTADQQSKLTALGGVPFKFDDTPVGG